MDRIDKFLDDLEETFAHIREREGGDSVCGLCEYDGAYIGESGDWCNECPGFNKDDCFKLSDEIRKKWKAQVVPDINVGDIISRQAAIDALDFEIVHMTAYCDGKNEGNPFAQYNKGLEDGKKAIEALPSARPEQRWILCSERLPKHGGRYLISVLDGIERRTTVAPYLPRCKAWTMTGRMAYWKVIAWTPLPEPWKEGEADD